MGLGPLLDSPMPCNGCKDPTVSIGVREQARKLSRLLRNVRVLSRDETRGLRSPSRSEVSSPMCISRALSLSVWV